MWSPYETFSEIDENRAKWLLYLQFGLDWKLLHDCWIKWDILGMNYLNVFGIVDAIHLDIVCFLYRLPFKYWFK